MGAGDIAFARTGDDKGKIFKHDGRLVITWNEVPGATYIVEMKRKRFLIFGDWEPLPFGDFTLDGQKQTPGQTTGIVVTDNEVRIGGLAYDQTYKFHIKAVKNTKSSDWSDTLEVHMPPPFIGIHKDHTVQYSLGRAAPAPGADDPSGYDLRTM